MHYAPLHDSKFSQKPALLANSTGNQSQYGVGTTLLLIFQITISQNTDSDNYCTCNMHVHMLHVILWM